VKVNEIRPEVGEGPNSRETAEMPRSQHLGVAPEVAADRYNVMFYSLFYSFLVCSPDFLLLQCFDISFRLLSVFFLVLISLVSAVSCTLLGCDLMIGLHLGMLCSFSLLSSTSFLLELSQSIMFTSVLSIRCHPRPFPCVFLLKSCIGYH